MADPKDASGKNGPYRRGMSTLGQSVDRITSPAMRKRGFAEAAVVTEWETIVGRPLCDFSRPERIAFQRGARMDGVLHLTVTGAYAPEVQHLSPQIVERINTYFGYRAVARLELRHGRIPPRTRPGRKKDAASPAPPDEATERAIGSIEDAGLREALLRLARARAAREGGGE